MNYTNFVKELSNKYNIKENVAKSIISNVLDWYEDDAQSQVKVPVSEVTKIEIERTYIPGFPLLVYKLPSGSPGHYIEVHEDPYDGVSVMIMNGELNEQKT